jgi:hypothetical protein
MEVTMAWTEITRRHYRRDALRYASDLTDAEWTLIAPFLPAASKLGRPRKTNLRSVVEAILYMASTGCQWREAILGSERPFRNLLSDVQLVEESLRLLQIERVEAFGEPAVDAHWITVACLRML